MERLLNPTKPPPAASNNNDPQAKRWHEMHALVIRGVQEPESLTLDEVRRISSVALIGMRDAGPTWHDAQRSSTVTDDEE